MQTERNNKINKHMDKKYNERKYNKFAWRRIIFVITLALVFSVVAFWAQLCAKERIEKIEKGEYVVTQPDSTKCDTINYMFNDKNYINKKFNKKDEE